MGYRKAQIDAMKHNIDFETAALIFLDPNRYEEYDATHDEYERKMENHRLGRLGHLVESYAERGTDGEIVRIVSAKKADEKERKKYYEV
jgi:uncharacterized DUF497 family protein